MIYLKFNDLSLEKQEELFRISREAVERRFGESIRSYVRETGEDHERLMEEEIIKNLYSYDYVFNI